MSASSLRQGMEVVLRDVPEALVGRDSRQRIEAVADRLPGRMHAPLFGFECALDASQATADLLVSAVGARNGPAALREAADGLIGSFPDSSWRSVLALADHWERHGGLGHFWLEFDLYGPAPMVPNLFFGPGDGDPASVTGKPLLALLSALGPELIGRPLGADLSGELERLAGKLPRRACVFQVGAMRARPSSGLRICINEVYFDGIAPFLESMDYPGDLDAVRSVCALIQPFAAACAIHVDLTPHISERVGVEVYVAPGRPVEYREDWERRFVEFLVREGMCENPKASALQRYSGLSDSRHDPERWPRSLAQAGHLIGRRSAFLRRIHHFKITCGQGRCRAKAYLAAQHVWLPPLD